MQNHEVLSLLHAKDTEMEIIAKRNAVLPYGTFTSDLELKATTKLPFVWVHIHRETHVVEGPTGLGSPRHGIGGEVAGILEHVLHRLDDGAGQRVRVEVHHRGDEVCLADHLR